MPIKRKMLRDHMPPCVFRHAPLHAGMALRQSGARQEMTHTPSLQRLQAQPGRKLFPIIPAELLHMDSATHDVLCKCLLRCCWQLGSSHCSKSSTIVWRSSAAGGGSCSRPARNQKQLLPPRSTWPDDGDLVQHFREAAQRPEERAGK